MSSNGVPGDVWFYIPSIGAAIFFTVFFGFITSGIIYRFCRGGGSRPFFCSVMVGMVFEVIGFAIRAVARGMMDEVGPFAAQQSLIVLAPLFIAAGNYLVISRIVCAVGSFTTKSSQRVLSIPAKRITPIFVTCDVVTILIQVSGTTIAAGSNWVGKTADVGSNVLLAGLAVQTITIGFFLTVCVRFGGRNLLWTNRPGQGEWFCGLRSTFISSVCIELRCIYRLIEHATGYHGYLFTHEWNFYVLEALPMIIATAVFVVWYPPHYIPSVKNKDGLQEEPEVGQMELQSARTGEQVSQA